MESGVCCSCCRCRVRQTGSVAALLPARGPQPWHSMCHTLDFSAGGSDFPGLSPGQNKQINHGYFAPSSFCCPPQPPALPASGKHPGSGVAVAQVWHLHCLHGVSSVGGGKCSKHWKSQYFVDSLSRCIKTFAVLSCLWLLLWIGYAEVGLGKVLFLFWSIFFSG